MSKVRGFAVALVVTIAVAVGFTAAPVSIEARADHWKAKGFQACMAAKTQRANRSVRYCQQHS